jgi:hypothetical protein
MQNEIKFLFSYNDDYELTMMARNSPIKHYMAFISFLGPKFFFSPKFSACLGHLLALKPSLDVDGLSSGPHTLFN